MIELKQIEVIFQNKTKEIHAVDHVSLTIEKEDIYGIVGYSGAGKSTLVRVINLLQRPTSGEVRIKGENLLNLSAKQLRDQRRNIGMIFQHFNLMNERTIFENVAFFLKYSRVKKAKEKVEKLLALVGLSDKKDQYPSQLLGGQKQRVAIARALANDQEILLCDEATSALDPKTTIQILDLLKKLNRELHLTIVLITHEMQVVKEIYNKVAVMERGRVVEQNDIVSIFSDPKKELTKDFIRTATHIDQALETIMHHPNLTKLAENEQLIELSFVGEKTGQPLIAELYGKYHVMTNILYGNVEILQQTPIGNLIVILSGETKQREKALLFLKEQNVQVKILKESIRQHQTVPLHVV